jgi:hypothetical protein
MAAGDLVDVPGCELAHSRGLAKQVTWYLRLVICAMPEPC